MNPRSSFLAACLLLATLLPGCVSETKYGRCVGMWQDDRRDPALFYDLSIRNVLLGLLFFELAFVPPVLVLHHETFCPTGKRPTLPPTPR